ncbi:MAG: hypothetical protein LC803_00480 [Acidobacteria bacterium]|nr:hypothetical protein [Acidobacteriota bacterium]
MKKSIQSLERFISSLIPHPSSLGFAICLKFAALAFAALEFLSGAAVRLLPHLFIFLRLAPGLLRDVVG